MALIAGLIWYSLSGDEQKINQVPTPPPATIKNKVLMVLPFNYTYYPDYENVRKTLAAETPIKLETASLSKTPQGVGFASLVRRCAAWKWPADSR